MSVIAKYIEVCRSLPPPHVPKLVTQRDTHMVCMCGQSRRIEDMPKRDSGVAAYRDNVCFGCRTKYCKLAKIICARCQEVVGHLEPATDPQDKFKFESNSVYHMCTCAKCCIDVESAEIVERILWRTKNNLPNPLLSVTSAAHPKPNS